MSSIWFAFSRKSMPDTFCMSLAIIGVYYGLMYLYENRIRYLFLFFIISSLAVLSKIPALYLLSVLAIPLFDKNVEFAFKRNILIVGALLLSVVGAWYFYWVPYLLATYGFQLYFPKQMGEGIMELVLYWPDALEKFYFSALQSFIAFAAFLMGIYLIVKQKQKVLLAIVLVASIFFILFIIKTGFVFAVHNYYVIPYVPIMALVAGFAIVKIKNAQWRILITTLIVVEALLNQQHDFRVKEDEKYKLSLEQVADNISDRTDLFAINSGQNPQQIYFLHRKGWTINNEQAMDRVFLNNLVEKGCKFLFINKHYLNSVVMNSDKNRLIVFENEHFVVYSLSN